MRLPQNNSPLQAHLDALATHLGVDAKDLRRAIVLIRTGRGDLVQEVIGSSARTENGPGAVMNVPTTIAEVNGTAPPVDASAAPNPEGLWFERISPDFAQSNQSTIAGAIKLVEAKKDLKKNKGSFVQLVEKLGLDLDKAERLMKIARHPVLSDSAHARNLPLSWMTLYTLAALPPKALEGFIADGTVYPGLERKQAERLVQKFRQWNSNGARDHDVHRGDADHPGGADHAGDHGAGRDEAGGDHPGDRDTDGNQAPADQPARDDTPIGPNSPDEIARKLARLEQLENETRCHDIQRLGYESEIAELKAQLGPETPVRAQRKLFRQAMRALQKSDTPDMLEREARFLRQSATTNLVELVRSTIRDGLSPDRLDLFYRPEVH